MQNNFKEVKNQAVDYDILGNDLISILSKKEDRRLLALENERGELCHYKQLATVKRGKEIYCLLKPLNNRAFTKGESILFKVTKEGDHYGLSTKIDKSKRQAIIDKIKSALAPSSTRP